MRWDKKPSVGVRRPLRRYLGLHDITEIIDLRSELSHPLLQVGSSRAELRRVGASSSGRDRTRVEFDSVWFGE